MKYRIVSRYKKNNLTLVVQNMIDDGWIPQGGVMWEAEYESYCQAMIKHPDPPKSHTDIMTADEFHPSA